MLLDTYITKFRKSAKILFFHEIVSKILNYKTKLAKDAKNSKKLTISLGFCSLNHLRFKISRLLKKHSFNYYTLIKT